MLMQLNQSPVTGTDFTILLWLTSDYFTLASFAAVLVAFTPPQLTSAEPSETFPLHREPIIAQLSLQN